MDPPRQRVKKGREFITTMHALPTQPRTSVEACPIGAPTLDSSDFAAVFAIGSRTLDLFSLLSGPSPPLPQHCEPYV